VLKVHVDIGPGSKEKPDMWSGRAGNCGSESATERSILKLHVGIGTTSEEEFKKAFRFSAG
jgi:hypothetical protein